MNMGNERPVAVQQFFARILHVDVPDAGTSLDSLYASVSLFVKALEVTSRVFQASPGDIEFVSFRSVEDDISPDSRAFWIELYTPVVSGFQLKAVKSKFFFSQE
jgi:hypothetical protein